MMASMAILENRLLGHIHWWSDILCSNICGDWVFSARQAQCGFVENLSGHFC